MDLLNDTVYYRYTLLKYVPPILPWNISMKKCTRSFISRLAIVFIALNSTLVTLNAHAGQYVLDNTRIAAHETKIKNMLTAHRAVEHLVLAAGAASTALFIYQTFFAGVKPAVPYLSEAPTPRGIINNTWSEATIEFVKAIFSYKTAVRLGSIAEHLLVAQLLQTVCNKTTHPHTLGWFALQHLHIQNTTSALRVDLQTPNPEPTKPSPYTAPLLNALVEKSEQIIAFMNIQKSNIKPESQILATHSAKDFANQAKQLFEHFNTTGNVITPHEATTLVKALDAFEKSIMRLIQIHGALQEI